MIGNATKNTVLQLASFDKQQFVKALSIIQENFPGFKEINLNCGCPSENLQQRYGAALMASPKFLFIYYYYYYYYYYYFYYYYYSYLLLLIIIIFILTDEIINDNTEEIITIIILK